MIESALEKWSCFVEKADVILESSEFLIVVIAMLVIGYSAFKLGAMK